MAQNTSISPESNLGKLLLQLAGGMISNREYWQQVIFISTVQIKELDEDWIGAAKWHHLVDMALAELGV